MGRIIQLCGILLLGASPCHAEVPKLFREAAFTCATLAEAVNHYVELGEDAAVKELEALTRDWSKDYVSKFSRNERVGWVCRILFQPKEKAPLRAPFFGVLHFPDRSMPLQSWPLY